METNIKDVPKQNVAIREYQGWTVNNTTNCIQFKSGIGHIILVSDREINELETMGVYHIVKHKSSMYKGLDLNVIMFKGKYHKPIDRIIDCYNEWLYDTRITIVNDASSYLMNHNKELLDTAKSIIHIYYEAIPRYKKSKWWCFWNKRKCIVSNKAISE